MARTNLSAYGDRFGDILGSFRHLEHELADRVGLLGRRPALAAAVVLAGDKPPLPSQDRLGREERPDLTQQVLAQLRGRRRQTDFLRLIEDEALGAQLLAEDVVLEAQVLDHLLLLAIHPARDGHEEESPWVEGHGEEDSGGRSRLARCGLDLSAHGDLEFDCRTASLR